MKSGTPNFIGQRLREAREARGINAISLAEMLGITRQAVSLYENNNASPQPEMMQKIADTLNLPISFFLKPIQESPVNNPIFYRSMSSATKTARIRAERWFYWLHDYLVPYIRQYITLPRIAVPRLIVPDFHKINFEEIENMASDLRHKWGLGDGPVSNMVLLLENNGVIISRIELCADTLDAFSVWSSDDNAPYIILSSDKHSAVRSRLDAAHELAHLVLHTNLNKKQINNSNDFKLIEDQAFRFASAFLVPSKTFCRDFYSPSLDALRSLKSKWLVSIGMMIKRSSDLNLITEDQAQRMWVNYNRRGWRKEEPLDNSLPIETPRLLRKALDLINNEKIQMPEQILTAVGLSPNDIEKLVYLKPGYFNEPIITINLKDTVDSHKSTIQNELDEILNNYNNNHE
jgi:Zn-dependent peptidase ImmA (M78 family)/transcriptional regulator with XRE-family HTH domain